MIKRIIICMLAAIFPIIPGLAVGGIEAKSPAGCGAYGGTVIEAGLREEMLASPDGKKSFLVYLKEKADIGRVYSIKDRDERGKFVFHTLRGRVTASNVTSGRYRMHAIVRKEKGLRENILNDILIRTVITVFKWIRK